MTLPASGPISIGAINLELGRASTTQASLNDSNLRSLAEVPSGAISLSNFYNKSNSISQTLTPKIMNSNTHYGYKSSDLGSLTNAVLPNGFTMTELYAFGSGASSRIRLTMANSSQASNIAGDFDVISIDGTHYTLNLVNVASTPYLDLFPIGSANAIAVRDYIVSKSTPSGGANNNILLNWHYA